MSLPIEESSEDANETENGTDDAEIDVQVEVPQEQNLFDDLPAATNLSTEVIDLFVAQDQPLADISLSNSILDLNDSDTFKISLLVSPVKIKVWSKNSAVAPSNAPEGSIVLMDSSKSIDIQTSPQHNEATGYTPDNPLVSSGIIAPELASIFYPPDEIIPAGRKRPLRQKSKARVMTSQEVFDDIKSARRN